MIGRTRTRITAVSIIGCGRGLITPRVEMRYMPDLRFRIDTALDYAEKIDRILRDPVVARDLGEKKQDE